MNTVASTSHESILRPAVSIPVPSFSDIPQRLPAPIARLEEVARNLWWSWSPEARDVFRAISVTLWRSTDHNPVKMLRRVTPERLEKLSTDPAFLKRYKQLMKTFDEYLSSGVDSGKWIVEGRGKSGKKPNSKLSTPHSPLPKIAYFSAEYGLHGSLPIYSGGLGILSGDHCKTASDLGLDFTALGFMYPRGYFEQVITADGEQIANYHDIDIPDVAIERAYLKSGEPLIVALPLDTPENVLYLQVWLVRCGRVKIYLMDSNLDINPPANREISRRLYGGDREYRLQQEIALGIGGVRVLHALGLEPDVWHANEGHVAFMMLERLRLAVKSGMSFEDAKEHVRKSSIFTTHTPVPAGHDAFSFELMERYFWHFWAEMGIDKEQFFDLGRHKEPWGENFNMTALSMNLSSQRNAVSKKHEEVTAEMWPEYVGSAESKVLSAKSSSKKHSALSTQHLALTSVTNGVHTRTWLAPETEALFTRELGKDWPKHLDDPTFWEAVRGIDDETFWRTRNELKTSLFSFITGRARRKWQAQSLGTSEPNSPTSVGGGVRGVDSAYLIPSGMLLDPSILTIGFARRFATYKRGTLLFKDIERLKKLLSDPLRPVQFIFSGKAHPADEGGKAMIRELWHYASDPAFGGRIAFIENYSMHVAKYLVRGVDVWMNNPKAPLEASGTSGMKAAINGVPNFSILDGWWMEGWNGSNGWGIEGAISGTEEEQDHEDAQRMYDVLTKEIIPLYYDKQSDGIPHGWLKVAKESIATLVPKFSTERMLREYVENLYIPAAQK